MQIKFTIKLSAPPNIINKNLIDKIKIIDIRNLDCYSTHPV